MSRKHHESCPDFLKSESEFAGYGRMVTDTEGSAMVWAEAKRLGVRVFEVKGWMGFRTPATYLMVHPEDMAKLPIHPTLKTWVIGLPVGRIQRKSLRSSCEVVRSYDPSAQSFMEKFQPKGFLSMHFA